MTENDWITATDPQEMLRALGTPPERKLRLFAVACVRRVWPLIADERSRKAVALSERAADEPISHVELDLPWGGTWAAWVTVVCYPKVGPCGMRVQEGPGRARKDDHEDQDV